MAQTEYIKLSGKLKWVRTTTPDKYGNWKATLYPDAGTLETIEALQKKGIKNVMQKDEDGFNMTFRRPREKLMRGKKVEFMPPKVTGPDGVEFTNNKLVGNGSDGVITVEVYSYPTPTGGRGHASRLHEIQITELVPYESMGAQDRPDENPPAKF